VTAPIPPKPNSQTKPAARAKSAPSTFTVDTTKPTVHITSPANGSFINASKPTISGTAGSSTGDQASVTVNVYSGSAVSASPTQTLNLTRSGGAWTHGERWSAAGRRHVHPAGRTV